MHRVAVMHCPSNCSGQPSAPRSITCRCLRGAEQVKGQAPRSPTTPERYTRRMQHHSMPRRTLLMSLAPPLLVLPDLSAAVRNEVSLWGQEVQLYSRQLQQGLGLNQPAGPPPQPKRAALNPQLGEALLQVPLAAARTAAVDGLLPGWDEDAYVLAYERIKAQELPYFRSTGSCGGCGTGPSRGLSDAAYVDFLSYCQYKALAQQLAASSSSRGDGSRSGTRSSAASVYDYMHMNSVDYYSRLSDEGAEEGPGKEQDNEARTQQATSTPAAAASSTYGRSTAMATGDAQPYMWSQPGIQTPDFKPVRAPQPAALTPAGALQKRTGRLLLDWVEDNLLTGPAKQVVALRTSQLDVVRVGVRSLLDALQSAGFMAAVRVEQLGITRDEYENHEVWVAGEPAFVRLSLTAPVTLRSGAALRSEEGLSQDFMFALLAAYLERCGVAASTLRVFPSLTDNAQVTEQFTVAVVGGSTAPEEPGQEEARLLRALPPFTLDVCVVGQEVPGCG